MTEWLNWTELWFWRRLLRISWTARKSILNIHRKDWCWSWSSRTLVTFCKGPSPLEKTHMVAEIEGKRRTGWQRMRWLDGIANLVDVSLSKLQEIVRDWAAWLGCSHKVVNSQIQLSEWTTEIYWVMSSCVFWITYLTSWVVFLLYRLVSVMIIQGARCLSKKKENSLPALNVDMKLRKLRILACQVRLFLK